MTENTKIPCKFPYIRELHTETGSPQTVLGALIWQNEVRSTAVPKLSISDERIYTVALDGSDEGYYFTVVDPDTGDVVASTKVGTSVLHDTLQMAGNMGADKVYWQGTLSGILRIYPARSLVSGKFLE